MTDIRWMFGKPKKTTEEEVRCAKCNIPLVEDDINSGDGQNCEDCGYEEDEEQHICGETGREFDMRNPIEGCGKIIDDENIMIGNISFCLKCGEEAQEDDTQYKETCSNCDTLLTIHTPIMCYTEPDGNDFTVCSRCYWECKFYETDINEDNKEEIEEDEDDGFGTAYYDGDGFADCDPQGNGNRLCPNSGFPPSKWCSECVYLRRPIN